LTNAIQPATDLPGPYAVTQGGGRLFHNDASQESILANKAEIEQKKSQKLSSTGIRWSTMNQRAYSFVTFEQMDNSVSYVLLGC